MRQKIAKLDQLFFLHDFSNLGWILKLSRVGKLSCHANHCLLRQSLISAFVINYRKFNEAWKTNKYDRWRETVTFSKRSKYERKMLKFDAATQSLSKNANLQMFVWPCDKSCPLVIQNVHKCCNFLKSFA